MYLYMCLSEKYKILKLHKVRKLVNKRREIFNKCRHRNKQSWARYFKWSRLLPWDCRFWAIFYTTEDARHNCQFIKARTKTTQSISNDCMANWAALSQYKWNVLLSFVIKVKLIQIFKPGNSLLKDIRYRGYHLQWHLTLKRERSNVKIESLLFLFFVSIYLRQHLKYTPGYWTLFCITRALHERKY